MSNRSVLVMMDFQRGIVERIGDRAVVDAGRRSVETARANNVPVVWVRVAFRPGYVEVAEANAVFSAIAKAGNAMVEDQPFAQIHAEAGLRAGDPIVTKRRVSAFSGSDLEVLLRAMRAETLVLGGIATSGVVLSTLRQAADLDFRLVVLKDACADPDPEVHRVLLEKVFPRQADVMTTAQWGVTLSGGSTCEQEGSRVSVR